MSSQSKCAPKISENSAKKDDKNYNTETNVFSEYSGDKKYSETGKKYQKTEKTNLKRANSSRK